MLKFVFGGSEPISSVLLQLNSRGLPQQTRFSNEQQLMNNGGYVHQNSNASFDGGMFNSAQGVVEGQTNDGQMLFNNVIRNLFNQNHNLNGVPVPVPHQLSYYMRNQNQIVQNRNQNQGFIERPQQYYTAGQKGKKKVSPISPLTVRAHMNMLRQMEKRVKEHVLPVGVNILPYEQGNGVQRLMQYILLQKNRPQDNNIQFWRSFVEEFFAPNAKKRWCVSLCKYTEQIDCTFCKVGWVCDMCNEKPCLGFEIQGEVLPRLHKVKYDIGLLEERLHIDTHNEYQTASGNIFLHFPKVIEETEYEQVRIVRVGQLRVIFNPNLKIRSWEFCAQNQIEYMRRNSITPQICQLGDAVQNYGHSNQDASSFVHPEVIQKNTNMVVSPSYQMVEALGMPLMNHIGIVKRYVRNLQISEVLNVMHDLIDYSRDYGITPIECMAKFLRFGSNVSSSGQQTPCAIASSYVPAFGNVNATASTSRELKRKRTFSGFTTSQLNLSPTFDVRTQTTLRLGVISAAAVNVVDLQQPQTSMCCLAVDSSQSMSTVQRIIQEAMAAQPFNTNKVVAGTSTSTTTTGPTIAPIGLMVAGKNNNFVVPNGIEFIDVETYEMKNNSSNDTTMGMTSSTVNGGEMEMSVFPQDNKSNYLPKEYEVDDLLGEFVDFEGLHQF